MNYNVMLVSYVENCPFDEPIFIEDIKNYFLERIGKIRDINQFFKTINVYINRLVKEKRIVQFLKGIYYKPLKGIFGEKKLNVDKVIVKKYLLDGSGRKGYYTGAYLFNKMGLTTQVPRDIEIFTNECSNANAYYNKNLGVIAKKHKLEINDENYKYLQLFDVLINKDNINIEVENAKEIIYKFIEDNKLEFKKIFEYAKLVNNKTAIDRLYELG